MRNYVRVQNKAENKSLKVCFFLQEKFCFYIINFSIFATLQSCFLRGDGEVRVSLAGLSLSNDAFVRTSAPCSKAAG